MTAVTVFAATMTAVKAALFTLAALSLYGYKWPVSRTVTTNTTFTHIIVGAGTGGSVVANRLTEDPTVTVLLIEAGGDPTFESMIPAAFPYLVKSPLDWNITSVNDNYTAQYTTNKNLSLPAGRALGGSSTMNHFYHVRGLAEDYKLWSSAADDDSWSYENLLPYFIRSERVEDGYILNSNLSDYHGTNGPIGVTRENRDAIEPYFRAFAEIGHNISEDLNTGYSSGYSRPMFAISNGIRQSTAESYLSPIRKRSNLYVLKNTMATKIIFDDSNVATGVECTLSDGTNMTANAEKDIILSAGALSTPKLLMLSGIGPSEHLTEFDIPVKVDSPVGEGYQDHAAVLLYHVLGNVSTPAASDPGLFPLTSFIGLNPSSTSQTDAECFSINLISLDNSGTLALCETVFGLYDDVCNTMYEVGEGTETLFSVVTVGRPYSTGKVRLQSTDATDPLLVYTGFLSNSTDMNRTSACVQDFIKITESSYFQNVGGRTEFFDLPNCTSTSTVDEYWECYILHMMGTTFHYSSTSRMGSVLDNNLCVKGVGNLRVVDASAMPNVTSGNINAAVLALAEKGSDLIKTTNCTV